MKRVLSYILLSICCLGTFAKSYTLESPDGNLRVQIDANTSLSWSVSDKESTVLESSRIDLQYFYNSAPSKIIELSKKLKIKKVKRSSVDQIFPSPFYKKSEVKDSYNQLLLTTNGGFSIEFRAYNDGAAYRFVKTDSAPISISNEIVEYNFSDSFPAFIPYINDNRSKERYCFSFESYYDEQEIAQVYPDSLIITPLSVKLDSKNCATKRATIMDAGVENYPGMFLKLNEDSKKGFIAEFAPLPLEEFIGGHARLNLIPNKRADYIAVLNKAQALPWRVLLYSTDDAQLADNDMAQRLAPKSRIEDSSWIKPGKVAWDWWNACNLTGVDFLSGTNTETYKYYIDFASKNRLEYIIIDEGWSGKESLFEELNPDINIPLLIDYANERSVGIILWSSWRNLAKETEKAFEHYSKMGIKGFKVDFFDRDDQAIIASAYEIARIAAEHHILLDYHGLKPNGIQRAYPNVVNFEGVKGLENAKWEPVINGNPLHDFPRYDVTAPFLRGLLGPMDYTPGAMTNAIRSEFKASNDNPMSQGTRAHQVAMYVVFEAPLQMLADSPSKYLKEKETLDFISKIPTTFDKSVALNCLLGEYISIARRNEGTWYLGAMTNWEGRELTLDFSFLPEGTEYRAKIFADGVNAHRNATDYKCSIISIKSGDKLKIKLASGGGWAAILEEIK